MWFSDSARVVKTGVIHFQETASMNEPDLPPMRFRSQDTVGADEVTVNTEYNIVTLTFSLKVGGQVTGDVFMTVGDVRYHFMCSVHRLNDIDEGRLLEMRYTLAA